MAYKTSSPALLAHREQQAEWARVWHSLSPTQRNGFQSLAAQSTPLRANGKPRVTAFLLFAQLNTALVNAGGEPITVPATAPQYPPTLPKQVSLTSSTLGKFALTLQSSPYAGKVVIYAAEPVMAGTNVYKESAFKVIGFLPSLGAGATNIAALYAATFRAPQSGEKVAVKIMGVSPAGYATMKQFVAAVTTGAVGEAAQDGTDNVSDEAMPLMLAQ